ncbi:transcription factor 20 isoform X2 [Pleurodeles waltl]|uniref:transcription factor 20 isoform X2 n=1 Tax=Pleurodeles waltl TaxID=8319 RepID=UPI0037094B7D
MVSSPHSLFHSLAYTPSFALFKIYTPRICAIDLLCPWPSSMQSFREQNNYHGTPQNYSQDVHGSSRLEEFSPRQQAPMFQSSFANRRGGTSSGSPVPPSSTMAGESPGHPAYQAYRKEASELYCLANKEASPGQRSTPSSRAGPGGRRPSGPVQSYGPPQGSAGFSSQYGTDSAHHGPFPAQHSALSGVAQYPQDYAGSFSPGGTQYQPPVAGQQHRQQLYQSHQPLQHTTGQSATSAAAHQQQMQRALAASSAGYPLRVGQFSQHYQTAAPSSSSSSSFPTSQRFGQSGQSYDGYSSVNAGSQYDGHMVGTNAQGYSSTQPGYTYQSQQMKGFDQSKLAQAGGGGGGGNNGGGGQQLTPPAQPPAPQHHMQYSNSTKITIQGQSAQYGQAEAPVRSPMQFQQNFSPISNPSPAPSVTQSPSCSSTPSPLMPGSGDGPQGGSGGGSSMPLAGRNRILQMMPQLSPTPSMITSPSAHSGGSSGYKSFGLEGMQEKRMTDPGLSSLNALSSQVANLPNTVQHMLLSDALAPHKNRGKRSAKKTDSGSNSETSSQAGEQQAKSPLAGSPDGGSSSSSEDQEERVRQLSGQSTGSDSAYKEAPYKEPPYKEPSYKEPSYKEAAYKDVAYRETPYKDPIQEKPSSPQPHLTKEPQSEAPKEDPGPAEIEETVDADEPPKPSEKVVGVIVSREAVASRTEKEDDDEEEEEEEAEEEEEDGGTSPETTEDPPRPQTPPVSAEVSKESNLPQTPYSDGTQGATKGTKGVEISSHHNGEDNDLPGPTIPGSAVGEKTEASRSPGNLGYPYKDNLTVTAPVPRNVGVFPQYPKSQEKVDSPGPAEKKAGGSHARNEKFPSLLQEVLQGYHHQERRYARNAQDNPALAGILEGAMRSNLLMAQASEPPSRGNLGKNVGSMLDNPHWGSWDRKSTGPPPEPKQINLAEYSMARKFEMESQAQGHDSGMSERRSVICDISPLRQLMRDPASHLHHHPPIGHVSSSAQERIADVRMVRGERAPPGIGQSVILPGGHDPKLLKENEFEPSKAPTGLNHRKSAESSHPFGAKHDVPRVNARAPSHGPTDYAHQESRPTHSRRGGGRMGGRGKSASQTHEFGEKMRQSPGRSRGPLDPHHVGPQMSLSDRASREAFYSAFFQNSETQALASAYHANARSSNYGEPHQGLTAPLHYKRQMYQQQEEFKDWANSAQALLSAQHRQEQTQRKSPRQEPIHGRVRSPYRSEKEVSPYGHPMPYHDISGVQEHSRSHKMAEGVPAGVALEMKQSSQRPQPVEAGWNLSQQGSPAKKASLPVAGNQKRFSPQWETDGHVARPEESTVSPKLGGAMLRLPGQEESHQNPLIMRRRVRSFISPIPSKRHPQDGKPADDKARPTGAPARHSAEQPFNSYSRFPPSREGDISPARGEQARNAVGCEMRGSQPLSLSSQAKTKILPPRKGRGLKLEAIVQKITSPSIRKSTGAPNSTETVADTVTLDDILSLKNRLPEAVPGEVPEVRKVDAMAQAMTRMEEPEDLVVKCDLPLMKPLDVWRSPAEDEVKEETLELPSIGIEPIGPMAAPTLQTLESNLDRPDASPNGSEPRTYLDLKSVSPARVPAPEPVIEVLEKERVVPCVPPKPDPFPPKGYFPSGKKKGRPIGSVNKQKKQQQQQKQPRKQQAASQQLLSAALQTEQLPPAEVVEGEPKPKRQRRERRKPAGPPRRRRTKQMVPIVEPEEPEIKLKYASQLPEKVEVRSKTFIPYIHVESQSEIGASCTIINAEEEEQSKLAQQVRKVQRPTSPQPEAVEGKALPSANFLQQGPVVTESSIIGRLVCCLCRKWANYKYLGDLFGPFYTQEYAAGLPKSAPTKRSSEVRIKLKVRHKSASDGSKSESDEEEEEIEEKTKEQRSLTTHPRFKRRNRAEAAARNTDSSQTGHADMKAPLEFVPEPEVQIPELPLDSNEYWVHEGCALWASGVYYVCGRLYGLQEAMEIAQEMKCSHCQEPGASLGCYNRGCSSQYHHLCAMESDCLLNEQDFSVRCPKHKAKKKS